jgi:hypothetical protein
MAIMSRYILLILVFMLAGVSASNAGGIADERLTPEIILDGMTHFEADQGIKDYKVKILEVTRETGRPEIIQVEKEVYFMAPNVKLTMIDEQPKGYADDSSFQVFLSMMDIERKKDTEIDGEDCFVVVATPRDIGLKRYTNTYYVAKSDYRKMRSEIIMSDRTFQFVSYHTDFIYEDMEEGEDTFRVVKSSETIVRDMDDNEVRAQTNLFREYEFNIGLTQKFFDKILEDYKTY